MKIVNAINSGLNKFGVSLIRYPQTDLKRRMKLINFLEINKLFDVGASVGNYGKQMRKLGYRGTIISFEPLSKSFLKLKHKSSQYKNWDCVNFALGDFDGDSVIHVARNYDSSSLLDMLSNHLQSAPESKYIAQETVSVKKLDTIFSNYYEDGDKLFLKIDTQGYERAVLDGGQSFLSKFKAVQLEMSIVPLYKDALGYLDMIDYMKRKNFLLVSLENGFSDPQTGRLLQMDGIFVNEGSL